MKPTEEQLRTLSRKELNRIAHPEAYAKFLERRKNANVQTPSVNPQTPAPDKRPEHANIDSGLLARGQNRK